MYYKSSSLNKKKACINIANKQKKKIREQYYQLPKFKKRYKNLEELYKSVEHQDTPMLMKAGDEVYELQTQLVDAADGEKSLLFFNDDVVKKIQDTKILHMDGTHSAKPKGIDSMKNRSSQLLTIMADFNGEVSKFINIKFITNEERIIIVDFF